jgi:hypothetical protein
MFPAVSALSKLVNYFYVHHCTSKPATAQEVHGHEACMHSSKDVVRHAWLHWPIFFRNKEQKVREHDGGNLGYYSL